MSVYIDYCYKFYSQTINLDCILQHFLLPDSPTNSRANK